MKHYQMQLTQMILQIDITVNMMIINPLEIFTIIQNHIMMNFKKNYNKKDEDINKLIGIISPIGIKSQSFVKELYINQIF